MEKAELIGTGELRKGQNTLNKKGISGFGLKMIAVITMFIDHFAAIIIARALTDYGTYFVNVDNYHTWYTIYEVMRLIGRMAFPIYCYLLVEGFHYTKNATKYALRLFLFALISEIPFDIALNGTILEFQYNNVFFTLWLGLLAVMGIDFLRRHTIIHTQNIALQYLLTFFRGIGLMAIVLFAMGIAEFLLCTDYGAAGVAAIVAIYLLRNHPMAGFTAAVILLGLLSDSSEFCALLMLAPLYFYNGTRGKQMKYFFYAFYPVHLLFIAALGMLMGISMIL